MKSTSLLVVACLAFLAPESPGQTCRWGGFDVSRLNYAGGTLAGSAHGTLRGLIQQQGGVIAQTPLLTPQWLATVDVFYTSLLSQTTVLSPAEQAALAAWVAGGGTLVVTADFIALPAYLSVTQPFGFGAYQVASGGGLAIAAKVEPHPISQGVDFVQFVTSASYQAPSGSQNLLRDDFGSGVPFLDVIEPATTTGGRIVVVGDHNLFTNTLIGFADNERLARNLVAWACPLCAGPAAGQQSYGAGWPGTNGVPTLTAEAAPLVGGTVHVTASNSVGQATSGFLLVGPSATSAPTALGGTILVNAPPHLVFPIGLPFAGFQLTAPLPPDPTLCGISVFLQVLEVDAGASHGVSFTPGLRLDLGS